MSAERLMARMKPDRVSCVFLTKFVVVFHDLAH